MSEHTHHHLHIEEHEHEHEHGECGCGCGHDHHHEEGCGCGHDHHHEEDCGCGHEHGDIEGGNQAVFILENLGCAHCAAKMEAKINELSGIDGATITFATKQLRVSGKDPKAMISKFQEICSTIESDVNVVLREEKKQRTKQSVWKEYGKEIFPILLGAIFFIGIEVYTHVVGIEEYPLPMVAVFILAYLLLGWEIIWIAIKNIGKGQIFDENFLMSVATIGALCIQQYPEAVGVMLFFRVGELFEHIAVEKSRSQIMEAVDLRPEVVNLVQGEDIIVVGAGEAKVGDVVLVRPGDRIPLDGVVVEGESRLDTSAVTGESVPVKVTVGSEILSGCVNTSGVLKVKVEKILEESMVSRILDSVENAAASKPKLDAFITRFARVYTPIVVLVALFTAVGIPTITGQAYGPWVYTALSFLVMSCPCALVLSVPLAFFCGIGAGSKRGILFKGGIVLEALSSVKAVVMDKTGTITEGNFVVQDVITAGTESMDQILWLAATCEQNSTHPIGTSIVEAAKGKNMDLGTPKDVTEISGKGIKATIDGQSILCGNRKLMDEFGVNLDAYQAMGEGSEVLVAVGGVFAGNVIISDTMKEEAPEAIGRIKKQGILTAMLTGDSEESAQNMARKSGVSEVRAKLLPEDKLDNVRNMRTSYGSVMFVGDGINDAPVLAGADVGAAMGSGADAAIEAADVVFMNSNMDAIPNSIEIAKETVAIARQNVIGALAIKIAVMILGLTGIYANMWLAVFADTGVAFICILNSIRVLYHKYK